LLPARNALLALTALVGLLSAAAVAVAPGAGALSPTVVCKFGGIRYVGSTSQKKDLCFTLSGNRKVIREYAYDYVDTCGSGTTRALNPRGGVAPVAPAGVFVRMTTDGFFKGVVRARTATGTFRQKSAETIPGKGSVTCDTHIVRWTARRVG
jgi:hypothetical protein